MDNENKKASLLKQRAYHILKMHMKTLANRNDIKGLEKTLDSRLFKMLPSDLQRAMQEELFEAQYVIIGRLANGEITPMMLTAKNKRKSVYIYYLRYLRDVVHRENPAKAKQLAHDVLLDILFNDKIQNKDAFDDSYFSVIFMWGENTDEQQRKSNHLFDTAIRK